MEEHDRNESHGWGEYRRLILSELKTLNDNITHLATKIDEINSNLIKEINKLDKRVVILETKAGILGAMGGTVTVIVVEIIKYFMSGKN